MTAVVGSWTTPSMVHTYVLLLCQVSSRNQ